MEKDKGEEERMRKNLGKLQVSASAGGHWITELWKMYREVNYN